jgi:hypothetical protein
LNNSPFYLKKIYIYIYKTNLSIGELFGRCKEPSTRDVVGHMLWRERGNLFDSNGKD